MDCHRFPERLFPAYFSSGPPDRASKHTAGGWGEYQGVLPRVQGESMETHQRFLPRRQTLGENWSPSEPVVLPLLQPKPIPPWLMDSSDMTDFGQHMENFYLDHYKDSFGSVSGLLHDNFYIGPKQKKGRRADESKMGWTAAFLSKLKRRKCEYSYLSNHVVAYDDLLRDVIHDIPPGLLGGLLREELELSSQQMQFTEATTGGALAHTALPQSSWLIYPAGPAFNVLNFQRVSLQCEEGTAPSLEASGKPSRIELKGPVRHISCATLLSDCCVAVRSDYLCGVWRCNETYKPKLLQVIKTRQPATCIAASPHVLGEVLLADESGSAYLWTVGKGMVQVRREDSNLYFNASSPWRWCEFSAHPRVMLYADRTGVELTDTRTADAASYTLFRIGQAPQCRSGERVVLGRYLADAHPFHHLVTTQYSAYIMDERFPTLPMLKWDHMMQAPPIFAQVLPGHASSVGGACSTKVVIGSQSSQEIVMLQYSGGSVEPCVSVGSPQQLLRPRDSLDRLPVQLPHQTQDQHRRLALPAAGLACFLGRRRDDGGGEDSVCVVQLTQAGDTFYQVLRQDPQAAGQEGMPPREEVDGTSVSPSQQSVAAPPPDGVAEDTGSEEEMIGPTQATGGPQTITERERVSGSAFSSSEEEGEEEVRRGRERRRYLGLELVVNQEADEIQAAQPEVAAASDAPGGIGLPASSDWTGRMAAPGDRAVAAWRRWLQQLLRCRSADHTRPTGQKHQRVKVRGFMLSAARDPITEDCLQSLRRDLGGSMASRSLLLQGATYLPRVPDPPALPDLVHPEAWADALSERLTVSWQGEEHWKRWWLDKLGLNKTERTEALRKRRRRDKAKRRSQRSLDVSSCPTEVDSLWGWSSSAGSHRGWSDTEDTLSQFTRGSELGSPRSNTSRVSQVEQWSPRSSRRRRAAASAASESLAGSLPDHKEGTPQRIHLWEVEGDVEPLFSSSQREVEGSVHAPGASTPGAATPGAFTPRAFTPGASTPGASTPGAFTPRAFTPRAFTPGASTPGAFTPRASTPGASLGRPGTQLSQVKRKRSQMGF